MHIDRKPTTVINVIDRIYQPIAQKMGVSLLLRNEINIEIQLQPRFFINLIQITGNLIANAIKFASPNGFVDVVFDINADKDHSALIMTVTNTEHIISPSLVSAFNQKNHVAKFTGTDVEDKFGARLDYVMQLVSEEGGCFFVKSEKDSGTSFSLALPLPNYYMYQRNGFHTVVKNGTVSLNNSLN